MGCCNYFVMTDREDSFETWQGLRGPRGETGPMGPAGADGKNVALRGPVETTNDLPEDPQAGDLWLVGEDTPYDCYFWNGEHWINAGQIAAGPGVPDGGMTGQYLAKNSDDSFDTGWRSPANGVPLMDGTADAGSSSDLSRADHVHPHDTSRQVKITESGILKGDGDGGVTAAEAGTDYQAPLSPYTSNPEMDGTASAGSTGKWADGGHVHPHDSLIVRENLLDNWFFVGGNTTNAYGVFPINQRAQSSYTTDGWGIDRWKQTVPSVTLASDGVTLANTGSSNKSITQNLNAPYSFWIGKKLTASVLWSDGTLKTGSLTVPSGDSSSGTAYHNFYSESSSGGVLARLIVTNASNVDFNLRISAGTTVKLAAVKLELGDTQTLAHLDGSDWVVNEIPDYGEQLTKCQRYMWRLLARGAYTGIGIAFTSTNANTAYLVVYNPVAMVDVSASNITVTPSSAGAIILTQVAADPGSGSGYYTTAIEYSSGSTPVLTPLKLTSTGNLTPSSPYRCVLKTGEYIQISREP